MVVGVLPGLTVKSKQVWPDASPKTLWLCELPSFPVSVSVNGPRSGGAAAHARSVEEPAQLTVQPAVQVNEAPKPITQTCW